MKNFIFGLKLWSINIGLIDRAIQLIDDKIFDYIELFVIPDSEISPFLIDFPYIIHIPHEKFGVNIGEDGKKEYNLQKINESIKWADALDARYMILHAGYGSMKNASELLHEIQDNRIIIENMPKVGLNGESMIGYNPAQIEELIADNGGLCLDIGHAIKASISLKIDYKVILEEFQQMDPKMFHISDGNFINEKDEHLDIGNGSYDFQYLKNFIHKNISKILTIETPRKNNQSLEDDIRNIEALKLLWRP